ncbi:MAG: hypothetical protein WAT93_15155 [Pontixanthobacter sp.]
MTASVMVDWANTREPPFTGEAIDGFADAITASYLIADEGRLTLHRWVDAARRAGLSWSDVGEVLGISKQAAQQRFRPGENREEVIPDEGSMVVRLGATAFNEMQILREEGEKGNELVGVGILKLIFRHTDHTWEYRREIGNASTADDMRKAGWIIVDSWLPFRYFKRPMGAG